MPGESLIAMQNVTLSLGQGASRVDILKGVDLTVARGETLGLIGPSGSGKSTLLMVMGGLEQADGGSVMLDGVDLRGLSEDRLALLRGRAVGIVFQSFHLIPTMTALENVAIPLELAGADKPYEKARHELDLVGLGARCDHYPAQLSGGEQQRVAIARALAPDPALLLADEPTGNLDETTGAKVADLLFSLQAKRGMTMVMVTHDAQMAARCGRVVRMRSGHLEPVATEEPTGPLLNGAGNGLAQASSAVAGDL